MAAGKGIRWTTLHKEASSGRREPCHCHTAWWEAGTAGWLPSHRRFWLLDRLEIPALFQTKPRASEWALAHAHPMRIINHTAMVAGNRPSVPIVHSCLQAFSQARLEMLFVRRVSPKTTFFQGVCCQHGCRIRNTAETVYGRLLMFSSRSIPHALFVACRH